MDSAAVLKRLGEVQEVLAYLSYSKDDVEAAICRLGEVLGYCAQHDVEGRNATFEVGIIKALLGILRSSPNPSLIAKVANCLALLVHGNEEGRVRLGSIKNIFRVFVDLLSPNAADLPNSGRDFEVSIDNVYVWDLSRADIYEQVLSVLRKLTYLNSDNQVRLAQSGGIKLLINLSMSDIFLRNSWNFGLESKRCLESLTVGKKLPCRATAVLKSSCGTVLSSFEALSGEYSIITAQYPAFYVSLATEERKWIASSMIENGVVWPDHTPFPLEDCKWTKVIVTSVENGNNMWCQFCKMKPDPQLKELQKSLDEMLPPLSGITQDFPLSPGNVYAAYCDPDLLHSPSSLSSEQWCRGRLLSVLPGLSADGGRQVVVFAVDFGFMVTLSESHLAPLPPQCRGVPPQAIPCRLLGVAPLPPRLNILENTAAVLRNLAFDSFTCRSEIAALKGVEALLELCQCPNEEIARQSMCALLNMSVAEKMRPELGQRGAIAVLLRICQRSIISEDLLDQTLHCLLNMLLKCSENTALFLKLEGDKVLGKILDSYKNNRVISQSITVLMNLLPTCDKANSSALESHQPSLATANRSPPSKKLSSQHLAAGHHNTIDTPTRQTERVRSTERTKALLASKNVSPPYRRVDGFLARKGPRSVPSSPQISPRQNRIAPRRKLSPQDGDEMRQLYEARRKANGERVRPNPIYRVRGDQSQSEDESSEGEMDNKTFRKNSEKEMECEASGSVTRRKCYLVNCALPGGTACDTRSFIAVQNINHVSRRLIRRTMCAMMNLGQTSTIFIGVLKDGIVKGVKLTKTERDQVCLSIDKLMEDFTPLLISDFCKIHFVPVAIQLSESRSLAIVDSYFVVEITMLESPSRQIYTLSERDCQGKLYDRCYYRMSDSNEQLSFQQLRDIIAWEVAESYAKEVRMLETRLKKLKALSAK